MDLNSLSPQDARLRPTLAQLPPQLLAASRLVRLSADQTVVMRNDAVEKVYYILEGELAVCNETSEGKFSVWLSMQAPTVISDLEILSETDFYAANVLTVTDCVALCCSVDDFRKLLHSDMDFMWKIATMVAKKNFLISHGRGNTAFRTSQEKAALFLLQYCAVHPPRPGAPTAVIKTRPAIASEVIVSQKTLDRSLNKLEEDGYIDIVKGKVHISVEQYKLLQEAFNSPA